ncbi:MAG: hypothetical protein K1X28_06005 [Parachlamydiales bacterium]|nr:hypothetical protein [Parachlamydiales bacterium]
MKLLTIFASLLFSLNFLTTQMHANTTAFYLSGAIKEFYRNSISEDRAYFLSDGIFNLSLSKGYDSHITFSFKGFNREMDIEIQFAAPMNQIPSKGIYRNAREYYSSSKIAPVLAMRISNIGFSNFGEFEIYEIEYGDNEEIKAFAADFAMKEFNTKPLFGSIRFNSAVPIKNRFLQARKKDSANIFLRQKNILSDGNQKVLISGEPNEFVVKELPYGGEGIEVFIHGNYESWTLDFAAPVGMKLNKGIYQSSSRYPFHGYNEAGIGVAKSRSCSAMPRGYFEVIDIRRNDFDKIDFLKLQFSIETEDSEIYEGTIDYTAPPHQDPEFDEDD